MRFWSVWLPLNNKRGRFLFLPFLSTKELTTGSKLYETLGEEKKTGEKYSKSFIGCICTSASAWWGRRFGLGSQQRTPGASCEACGPSPQTPGGHLREVFGAWLALCRVSCWSRTAKRKRILSNPRTEQFYRQKFFHRTVTSRCGCRLMRFLTCPSAPHSASSRRSDREMTCTARSAFSRSICNQISDRQANIAK